MSELIGQVYQGERRANPSPNVAWNLHANELLAGVFDQADELPESEPDQPAFALPLDEFIAIETHEPPALLGVAEDAVLPAHGLLIAGGKPGVGKTTFAVDLAFHLASGVDWLGIPVTAPLRVLLIENEGPLQPFRRKIERKRLAWGHELEGEIFVQTLAWGALSFADAEQRTATRAFLDVAAIDVVFGDPLGSLGIQGVGSPADTRDFLTLLRDLGLFQSRAFVLPHHFRKEPTPDEIDELSGAWAGHADSLLILKGAGDDRLRLSFPKLRWGERREPVILELVEGGFTVVAAEKALAAADRDVTAEVRTLLADGAWRTANEVATGSLGGIGKNRAEVEAVLEQLVELGEAERVVGPEGRHSTAVCFRQVVSALGQAQTTLAVGHEGGGCPEGEVVPFRGPPDGTTSDQPLSDDPDEDIDW